MNTVITDTAFTVTVVDESSISIAVGIQGPRGLSAGAALVGEDTTRGIDGCNVSVTGFTAPEEYEVAVSYLENPGGNGVLFVEKFADYFSVKHYGDAFVKFSYIVSPVG